MLKAREAYGQVQTKPMEVSREEEWPERVSAKGEGTKEGGAQGVTKKGEEY